MRPSPLLEGSTMLDFKCAMQSQLDNLWLKPEDLARGLDIRVSSVRKWLDPELDCVPVKDAFDWVYAQTEKLGELTKERLNQANDAHDKFGEYIVRWHRPDDLPENEPLGLQNLASHLVCEQLNAQGVEAPLVYACRNDDWIDRHLDDFPDIDPKAVFAAATEAMDVSTSDIARALNVTARSIKDWKNPKQELMLPVDDAWAFLDEYRKALEGRTAQFREQRPNPLPYHPTNRRGVLTQQQRIDNRAALAAAKQVMNDGRNVIEFSFVD